MIALGDNPAIVYNRKENLQQGIALAKLGSNDLQICLRDWWFGISYKKGNFKNEIGESKKQNNYLASFQRLVSVAVRENYLQID